MHAHGQRLSAALATTLALLATFGVLFAGAPAAATHDATAWSFYQTVGGGGLGDANNQQYPSVLTDRAGSVYVFYHDWNQPTGNSNVYVTKIATGGAFGLPQLVFNRQVNPTLPNAVRRTNAFGVNWAPAAAMDHNGNLYVAWAHTGLDVYVSKSSDGGNAWGAPVMVSDPANNNYAPAITVTTDDDVWVSWYQVEPSTGRANVTIARSTDLGATFGSTVDVTGPFPGSATLRWHDLGSDAADRLYVGYMSDVPGAESHVNLTWSDDGSTWSSPSRLDGGAWAGYPKLTVDAQGRVHMGWFDQRFTPSGSLTFWYRRSDDQGATWTLEVPVNQGLTAVSNAIADIAVYGDLTMFGWNGNFGGSGMGYALSADGGDLWYPEAFANPRVGGSAPAIDADENGTFYAAFYHWNEFLNNYDVGMMFYDAPPSEPAITFIVRGSTSLTVQWTTSPEPDVSMYRLWRSQDGSSYALVATVGASTTSYPDAGLAPGTYWYRVTAVDWRGTSSHPSAPVASTIGMTVDERFDAVQAQIDALEAALALAQGDIDSLLTNVNDLTRLVGIVRSEQATAAMSTLMLILLVIVLILLILLLVRSRRPGTPQTLPPMASPTMQGPMPPGAPPRTSENPNVDDL